MQSNVLTSLIESNPIKPKSLCEPLGLFTLNKSVVHSVNPIADRVYTLGPHMENEHQSTRLQWDSSFLFFFLFFLFNHKTISFIDLNNQLAKLLIMVHLKKKLILTLM